MPDIRLKSVIKFGRGAELIEELRQKQMYLQEDQEVRILEKIKVKMERIKANQKKIQGAMTKEAPHHDHGKYLNSELVWIVANIFKSKSGYCFSNSR